MFQFHLFESLHRQLDEIRDAENSLPSDIIDTQDFCKSVTECLVKLALDLTTCFEEVNCEWRHVKRAKTLHGDDLKDILCTASNTMKIMRENLKATEPKLENGIDIVTKEFQSIAEKIKGLEKTVKDATSNIAATESKISHSTNCQEAIVNKNELEENIKKFDKKQTRVAFHIARIGACLCLAAVMFFMGKNIFDL